MHAHVTKQQQTISIILTTYDIKDSVSIDNVLRSSERCWSRYFSNCVDARSLANNSVKN
jgi:hypothetical protein